MPKRKVNTNISKLALMRMRYQSKNWFTERRFNRLLERMKTLSGDEKQLVMELTDKFEHIDIRQLVPKLQSSLIKLVEMKGHNVSTILLAPLKPPTIKIKESDFYHNCVLTEKSKSADYIFELLARHDLNIDADIKICSSPKDLIRCYKDNCCIALVDDFVGSGETASTCVREYKTFLESKNVIVNIEQFSIVVAAAMKEGVAEINKYGMDCFAEDIMDKGITCDASKKQFQRDKNVSLMKSIEGKLMPNMSDEYSFGYHHSEALISILDKAPNNTFPFYWYTKGTKSKAIFRRNYGG